jgi:membrane-associated phospholipid phosphatase
MLFALVITRLYKTKWRWLAWIYPALIWIGTTYMGEHYAIDIVFGILYAVAAYWAAPYVLKPIQKITKKLLRRHKPA